MGWSELGAEGPLARGGRALRTLGRIGLLRPRFLVSISRAYLRHGQSIATGVAAAALKYFGKSLDELSIAEAQELARKWFRLGRILQPSYPSVSKGKSSSTTPKT